MRALSWSMLYGIKKRWAWPRQCRRGCVRAEGFDVPPGGGGRRRWRRTFLARESLSVLRSELRCLSCRAPRHVACTVASRAYGPRDVETRQARHVARITRHRRMSCHVRRLASRRATAQCRHCSGRVRYCCGRVRHCSGRVRHCVERCYSTRQAAHRKGSTIAAHNTRLGRMTDTVAWHGTRNTKGNASHHEGTHAHLAGALVHGCE